MKFKMLRNYYSKLSFISVVAVFFLILIITSVALVLLHNSRVSELKKTCENVLDELVMQYSSIWDDYYKAFIPLNNSFYAKDLQIFCKGEGSVYEQYEAEEKFERILASVCQQDDRIAAVYFRRLTDDSRYLYLDSAGKMVKIQFGMSETDSEDVSQRTVVGGRRIRTEELIAKEQDIFAYGLQSKLLSSGGIDGKNDYQITVLYGVSTFDKILSEYHLDSDVRFLLTMHDGLVLYDSRGEYACNEDAYFRYAEKVLSESETLVIDQGNDGCLAFCFIPPSDLSMFQMSSVANLVIVFAIIINIVMILVMLSMNRLTNQKFQVLENGMKQLGKSNLRYRLPVGKNDDEFTRIAAQFNVMCDELEEMINKNYVYQILQRNAEYKALQTSINPHFLYNSMEALREKVDKKGMKDEAEMILLLSRIFEYQIRGKSVVIIEKELSALQNYIDFYSICFQYAFDYFIDFEEQILDYMIPKQIFQPIMENYFAHGFRGDGMDVICVKGYLNPSDNMIHICFSDNGKGIEEERLKALRQSLDEKGEDTFHIGLRNVHQRLKIVFGNESRVEITPNLSESGICVSLVFSCILKSD